MANVPSANYTPAFQKAGLASDPVDVSTGTVMPNALDTHDHTANKGLGVARLANGTLASRPAAGNAGNVYASTDTPRLHLDDGTTWHPVYSLLSEIAGDGAITLFNFSSIPAGFRNLEIVVFVRSAAVAVSDTFVMQFNGDVGGNYLYSQLQLANTTVTGAASTAQTSLGLGSIAAANATASYFTQLRILIASANSTTGFKNYQCWSLLVTSAAAANMSNNYYTGMYTGATQAVTGIQLKTGTGPIVTGSFATLYGF